MKLTWFGGTTMRVHIGGTMLVIDAEGAPGGIDRTELVSGADRVVSLASWNDLGAVELATWAPRRARALIEEGAVPPVTVYRAGAGVLVMEAVGEPPLLIVSEPVGQAGRWAANAVVVVTGAAASLPALTGQVLETLGPKLIAVAGPEAAMDAVIVHVRDALGGTGLIALEPGLALEV